MTGIETKEGKSKYNLNPVRKDIPPRNGDTRLTSHEDKEFDATVAFSKQHKMSNIFPDIYSSKAKTVNDTNSEDDKPRDGDTVKLPEVKVRPGKSLNLSKVLS